MRKAPLYDVLLVLALVGLVLSVMYLVESRRGFAGGGFCNITAQGTQGCKDVYASPYSSVLGFSNAYMGIGGFFFLSLMLVYFRSRRSAELALVIFLMMVSAFVAALWFLYIQRNVLQTYCGYCLIIDAVVVLMGILYGMLLARDARLRWWTQSA